MRPQPPVLERHIHACLPTVGGLEQPHILSRQFTDFAVFVNEWGALVHHF